MAIQNKIGNTQTELDKMRAAQNPPLLLSKAWGAFSKSNDRHDCGKDTLGEGDYEAKWAKFVEWIGREHTEITTLCTVDKEAARGYIDNLKSRNVAPCNV